MWTRVLLAAGIAAVLRAQQDPMDLLRLVQAKVADSLDRVPRYMCTETIDRSQYDPAVQDRGFACDEGRTTRRIHLSSSDRLRFDVAMGATGEMYSWVGASRFNDRDLLDMVDEGAISTGSFAAFLTAIFRTADASFTYNGETSKDGRTLSEFGFQIPYQKSHYFYGQGIHRVITAYNGTFLVDPKTADLVRLDITSSQLPAETGACYVLTTLDYEQVRLRGVNFLLPSASLLRILNTSGGKAENRTEFSSCHEFLGESKISFDPPAEARATEAHGPALQAFAIPKGLPFRVVLTQDVNTEIAAAGDPIEAKLMTPIQNGATVIVPAGAAVATRIVRVREFHGNPLALALEVKLETVQVGGVRVRLNATLDTGAAIEQKRKKGTLQRRVDLGTLRGLEDHSASFIFYRVHFPYLIRSGLESSWVTADSTQP